MRYVPSLTRVFSLIIKLTYLHRTGGGKEKFQSDFEDFCGWETVYDKTQ